MSPLTRPNPASSIASACLVLAGSAAAQTKLLRFPDIHAERVAFCYAGDIWTTATSGGAATRVTAHAGQELFPRFSPDGQWIAFTGQYDGDEQVYVVPSAGGIPRQLTFYPAAGPLPPRWGYDNQVYGWTADGQRVLYRSLRDAFDLTDSKLYTVGLDAGLPEQLPLPYAGAADISPDGKQVVYSPLVRDFRTWKRYAGGWAQELWIFDLASHDTRRVTDDPRADRDPMWIGGSIYFTSDRSGTNNLFRYEVASAKTTQVTQEATWDLRWPATDHKGRIVFELDGELELLDTATGKRSRLAISVPHDGLWERPGIVDCAEHVEDYSLSPKGERALFSARGEIFSAPVEHGTTYDLSNTPGAHERAARWSPDGKQILFVSDRDGEDEFYVMDAPGVGTPGAAPVQLTHMGPGYRQNPVWSPDGKRFAFSDQNQKLYVYELESFTFREIADDPLPFGLEYAWSPDSRWIAYSLTDRNEFRSIWLWSTEGGESRRLTDELWNEYSPAWDPKGDYLYFLADRDFAPQIDSIEWNFSVNRETSVYAIALREDVAHPAPPRNDAVSVDKGDKGDEDDKEDDAGAAEDEDADEGGGQEKDAAPEPLRIDLDGIERRVARLPIEADNLAGLTAVEGHVIYVTSDANYYGRDGERTAHLEIYSLEERESKTLFEDAGGYDVSGDGKKLIVSASGYQVIDAKPGAEGDKKTVSTDGLRALRDPPAEWSQIFHEVWRRYRDFFYVDNLHGYDWKALGDRYAAWLPHVAHRSDLNYLIGEMIAELNVGHAYIAGGEYEIPPRPQAALLGARLELDAAAGRYRIARIIPGQNEEPRYRSPLTEVGVNVAPGDYLLAIDGRPLGAGDNPDAVLRHKGSNPLQLVVNSTPDFEGARTVTVSPIGNEDSLLYLEWVQSCRRMVDELSGGKVGYLHIPDMGSDGIYEFIKWYYGQLDKQGLVVDARSNGGGNVSPMIMERLLRKVAGYDFERNRDFAEAQPGKVFGGRLVALCDEDTASDGDQFSWYFKNAGLGELVGKRTWGGVVGIYGRAPLMDGGAVSVPEAGTCDVAGQWAVEGYGVDPTIVVENDPKALLAGRDPQLERAVAEVLADIRERPVIVPPKPAGLDKTK